MTQATVTFSLEEFLKDFKSEIGKRFDNLETEVKEMRKDITQLKVDLAEVKSELKSVKDNSATQKNQLWALIALLLAAFVKFGFFPNFPNS
jgi:septal ring factor EnvC (AmiA/AmiB activator)